MGQLSSLDLKTGWDFRRAEDRKLAWWIVQRDKPEYIILSPVFTAFSNMFVSNCSRTSQEERLAREELCMEMLLFRVGLASNAGGSILRVRTSAE